jgi:hypothetical protein
MRTALLVLLLASPALAETENTRQLCSDHADNDGDGRVDCADQDCWDLTICANLVPGSSTPATVAQRKSGYTRLVLGAVLLPLGVIVAAASAGPFVVGAGTSREADRYALYGVGGAMDALGLVGIAAGTALLALGVGDIAASHDRHVQLAPSSLRVTF